MLHQKALIISFTPVASSPRVIRQAEILLRQGYRVYVAGYAGKDQAPSDWHLITLPQKKQALKNFYGVMGTISVLKDFAYGKIFFIKQITPLLQNTPVDLILCHDYYTAPLGHALSQLFGCEYWVDAHEHALTQNEPSKGFWQKIRWALQRRFVHNLQKTYFPQAKVLTTVSDGIADSLQADYGLTARPTVIRSTPFYEATPYRPIQSNGTIKLLYHGVFVPNRGLEECIQAMAFCADRLTLNLRGEGENAYQQTLLECAQPTADRVFFEPPVPFHEIVSRASHFDVGLFVSPTHSTQRQYTLPNKFFEYIMAGLALVVIDLPEMARIIQKYDCGVLVPDNDPQTIATILNQLTPEKINHYKKQSLKAAKELCWEKESEKFVKLLEQYGRHT